MLADHEFDDMVDACIDAGTMVKQSGSEELQVAMRVVLVILGYEVARRKKGNGKDGSAEDGNGS